MLHLHFDLWSTFNSNSRHKDAKYAVHLSSSQPLYSVHLDSERMICEEVNCGFSDAVNPGKRCVIGLLTCNRLVHKAEKLSVSVVCYNITLPLHTHTHIVLRRIGWTLRPKLSKKEGFALRRNSDYTYTE